MRRLTGPLSAGLAVLCLLAAFALPASAAELIMLQDRGCPWCERFNREIAPAYPLTPEGKRAPLRRVDMRAALPDDLKFLVKGSFTPTFVLIDNGREIGRIRGYPGDEFFWGLLGQLMARLPPIKDTGAKRVN